MSGYLSMKMKRKDLDEVYNEFSEFSLCSPARKIRRLDVDLPPIMEEEEAAISPPFMQPVPEEHLNAAVGQVAAAVMEEEAPSFPLNEERALVLYKPVNTPLLQTPSSSDVSFKVNSDLIPGFKNHQIFWSGHPNIVVTDVEDWNSADANHCRAVVPWVPSQHPAAVVQQGAEDWNLGNGLSEELMEAEEVGCSTMEVEEENSGMGREAVVGGGNEGGLKQWQQQHCMTAHIPQNLATPIMWTQ